MKNQITLGHLMAALTIFIWGTTFVSTKILLTELAPVEILFFRFALAYLALFLVYPQIKKPQGLQEELLFCCLGLSGIALYYLVENIALQYTLASNVGLLISAAPILTAIVAHLFTNDEKLSSKLVIGFLLAIGGVFLVIFNGKFILKLNPLGDVLALAAAVVWAIYSVLLKKVNPVYNSVYVVRKTFFYGLLIIVPLLFIFKADLKVAHAVSWPVLLNILFLGFAASALCFVTWNQAVKLLGVIKTSNYIYLVPLITMAFSILILREKVNGLMILGGFLIFSGVYIADKGLTIPKLLIIQKR